MKFLLDECCSAQLVKKLRKSGHDILFVTEKFPGATDRQVLQTAYSENRILITEDKDFGELIFRLKKQVVGIILLRFTTEEREQMWPNLRELLALKQSELKGKFVVVDAEKYRIRSLQEDY